MKTKIMVFIFSFILIHGICFAYNYWEKLPGTDGGISSIIKGNGDTIFATFDNKYDVLLISSDNGHYWKTITIDSSNVHILSLTIDEKNGYLFAGTEYNGILRSTDNGQSWQRIANDSIISCVPSVFADTAGNVYCVECMINIWHSSDNGNTWEKLCNISNGGFLFYNSFHINNKGYFYALFGNQLYCSKDKGNNWTWIKNLNDSSSIIVMFIDKNDDLYLGGKKVYKSTDDGTTWDILNIDDSLDYITLIYVDNADKIIVGGEINQKIKLYLSIDKGKTWKNITEGISVNIVHLYSIILTNDDYYLLGTYWDGIYRSSSMLLDVKSNDNENIPNKIKPNPASDFIMLTPYLTKTSEVIIYSTIGTEMYKGNPSGRIDVSFLSPGIYFLKAGNKILKFFKY